MSAGRRSTARAAGPHDAAAITCRGLHADHRRRPVLSGLDLSVGPGITVVAGANGSGKSTLLRVLAGLHPVRRGRVRLGGADLGTRSGRRSARGTFGYLAQDADFPGTFTVRDAVAYAAWLQRVGDEDVVRSAIERVGLASLGHRPLGRLSGGERRRALLAQSVVHDPSIVLLDEPTAGLDATHRLELHDVLRAHVRAGDAASASVPGAGRPCVVVVTHHGDDVVRLAERVVVLAHGAVAFDGSPGGLTDLVGRAPDAESVDRALEAIQRVGAAIDPGVGAPVPTTCGGRSR